MIRCKVDDFKEKYGISPSANIILLHQMEQSKQNKILSYVNSVNRSALMEGYKNPLFDVTHHTTLYGITATRVKINEDNIKDFDNYLDDKEQYEYFKERDLESFMQYEDDQDLSEEQISNEALNFQDNKPLYSYMVLEDENSINENPKTLYEWRESRINLKKKLEDLAKKYGNLKNKSKQKQIYNLIEDIENQIVNVDDRDPNSIYESVIKEIEILNDFLNDSLNGNIDGVNTNDLIESNLLYERLEDLGKYFLAEDPLTGYKYGYEEVGDRENPIATFYFDFKEQLDEKKSDELKLKIISLKDKFNRARINIIKDLLENDTLIKYHKNNKDGFNEKELIEVRKMLEDENLDIDKLAMYFLGAKSGGGLLGNLLYNLQDSNLSKEIGHTQEKVRRLSDTWQKIKLKKDNANNWIIDNIFKKDSFGIRTNELISKYTSNFTKTIKNVAIERNLFYKGMSADSYRNWMNAEKNNYHRINPMLLQSIVDKYKNHSDYNKYFIHSNEEIKEYEQHLRNTLGDVMFEIETKKALELIDDYVDAVDSKTLTFQQEYRRNPFEFTKHFNSDEYNKIDSSTGWYLEPNFTRFIPKETNKDFYNKDFDILDKDKDLSEFYKVAQDLTQNYTNPILKSEGIDLKLLELPSAEDALERTTLSTYNFYGRISAYLTQMYSEYISRYYNSSINSTRKYQKEIKEGTFKRKIQTHSLQYGKRELKILIELYNKKSLDELLEIAKKENYNLKNIPDSSNIELTKYFKNNLINSLAQNEINKSTSTNIFESVKNGVILANEISAKQSTTGTLETLKSFAHEKQLSNVGEFLTSWGDTNHYGYRFSRDLHNFGGKKKSGIKGLHNSFTKLDSEFVVKPTGKKFLTTIEQKVRDILKEEKKALNNGKDEFNFKTSNNVTYYTKNGNYFVQEGEKVEKITLNQITEQYGKYLDKKIEELGIDMTNGSFALGVMQTIIKKSLFLNVYSGIRNREAGYIENAAVAASKKYGFNDNHLRLSNRMLAGTNTRKYFLKKSFENSKRGRLIETFKILQSTMQLSQNRADELAIEGAFANESIFKKFGNFLMDFSVNNPEWHTQTELMLSIMQITKVKDINGKEHFLLDGKTQESIWISGTLKLKPEFDTPENRAMWVEFKETEDGKNDSLFFVNKVKTVIERTQGNYNNRDIVMIQSSVSGKLSTMFQRYLFENTNMQWGHQKFDPTTGEMDVYGRKKNLAKHAPTAAVYLAGMHGSQIFSVVMASVAGLASAPIYVGVGLPVLITLGVIWYRKRLISNIKLNKNEGLLAVDFAKETFIRMLRTPIVKLSYGKYSFGEKQIETLQNNFVKRNLTERERLQLSECSQDLASKVFYYSEMTIIALLVKMLWTICMGDGDDEDKDSQTKRKIRDLVDIEGKLNAIINNRNSIINNLDKFSNPNMYKDEASSFSYFRTLDRTKDFFIKDVSEVLTGEKDVDKEFLLKTQLNVPVIDFPNTIVKSILSEDKGIITDNKIYEGMTEVDKKLIFKDLKPTEDSFKSDITEQRSKLKDKVEEIFRTKVEKENPDLLPSEIDDRIEKEVDNFLKPTHKKKNETYEENYNRIKWNELEEDLKKIK